MNDWSGRQQKELARHVITSLGKRKRRAVMLPSKTMHCIKQAEEDRLFDENTECLCVERDPETFREMVEVSKTVKPIIDPFNGDLHLAPLNGDYDYAFFDLNGPLTGDVTEWLDSQFARHIANGADVAFTFLYAYRNNKFIHDLHEFVVRPCMRPFLRETSIRYCGVADETIAMYLLMFRLIFHKHDFVVDTPIKYRDTQAMLMFLLKDFRPGSSGLPPEARQYFELFMKQQFASRRRKMSKPNAADKAWKTRRANSEKRSQAAVKAWETRRCNALAQKRSEAAKKAWVTRRAQ